MNGFQFATYLDLNRDYYNSVLSPTSREILGIIFPWGKYCYTRISQESKISAYLFQERRTTICKQLDDPLIYIDNIILHAKKEFDHHILRLEQVLIVLQKMIYTFSLKTLHSPVRKLTTSVICLHLKIYTRE